MQSYVRLTMNCSSFTYPIILLFCFCCSSSNSYKILIYSPSIGHSHVMFAGKIADTLLDAGHEVVIFMPLMDPDVTSNGTNRARIIRYQPLENENTWSGVSFKKDPFDESSDIMTDENIETIQKIMNDICEGQISNKQLLRQLRDEKFDLVMGEMFDYCSFGIFELLNIPARILTSAIPFGENHAMVLGVPAPPSYVPHMMSGMTDEMSYSERMINLYIRYIMNKWTAIFLHQQNALFRRYFGEDFPCLVSLAQKNALVLVNGEEMFELARPISHKVIHISGIGIPEPKPLDEKLEKIIAKGEKGAVYLSFGSLANCSRFPLEKKLAILEAFASFPEYQFIWKYEQPENDWHLFENYTNIHPVKWTPQVDLLNHPKMKAFITHGGMNSVTEAIHFATPMVAIPLFGDQEHNVATAVKRGVAVSIDRKKLTAETLTNALRQVLNDDSFTKNAETLAAMIAKKPMKPKELVVKWTEFVAEFKDLSNLDLAGRDFGFIKYYCLDIFISVIIIAIVALFITVKFALYILNAVRRFVSVKEKKC